MVILISILILEMVSHIEEISIKIDAEKGKIMKYQKLLLLSILASFRPILWPRSHNSYK